MPSLLVIPVENQVRELDAKLLLACAAAERGFRVVIGSRRFIDFWMPFLPRGIFLAKSMTPVGHKMLRLIHDLGHDVVAWDEETLVRYDAEDYPKWRFSPAGFAVLNHIFAWGPDDAELFAWVDTAMNLSMRNRRLMGYLVSAQERRWGNGPDYPLAGQGPVLAVAGAPG